MKGFVFLIGLLCAWPVQAGISSMTIEGKIVSFDAKTVIIEIAGSNYRFKRDKLGPAFSSLTKGETVKIAVK